MGNFLGQTISKLTGVDLNGRFGCKGFTFNLGCDRKDEKLVVEWGRWIAFLRIVTLKNLTSLK